MNEWYESHSTLVSVAEHAIDVGEIFEVAELQAFYEKPWNYPELHAAWVESTEGETS